jgi:hypothetical protein
MATPNHSETPAPAAPTHMLRISHESFLALRLFGSQLEQLTGRTMTRDEAFRVALECARNATDDQLSDYL